MTTFAEQLTAARKAAGMTQEELSAAVHVARNTISNWEHGRTQPDLDTLRLLGQVLHTDFLNSDAAPQSTETVPPPAVPAEGAAAGAGRNHKKRLIVISAAAVILAAAVATGWILFRNAKLSKTALITLAPLTNPAPMIADPDFEDYGLGWEFSFVISNAGEVAYKPKQATMLFYDGEAVAANMVLDYAFLRGKMYGDTITNTDPESVFINWGASYPLGDRVKLILEGTDANGHELEYTAEIELSQEKPQQ